MATYKLLARALLALLALGSCGSSAGPDASRGTPGDGFDPITTTPTFAPLSTTTTPREHDPSTSSDSTASTTTPDTATTAPSDRVAGLLSQLVVAPEEQARSYERDRFEHWVDADRDGCRTRCEVLEAERHASLPGLPDGGWVSIYDGYTTDDPSELEIDHVVALAEAWRSGASEWDDARRRAFANDLDEPGALAAVTSATNRAKSDKDPAEWQPPNRDAWCEWGLGWLRTKVKWGLTADEAEVRALTNILRGC